MFYFERGGRIGQWPMANGAGERQRPFALGPCWHMLPDSLGASHQVALFELRDRRRVQDVSTTGVVGLKGVRSASTAVPCPRSFSTLEEFIRLREASGPDR